MKAGSLWPGTDYAYYEYRGRGRPLPLDAKCVKVLELQEQPVPGGKRNRTLALVAFMDDEGGAITEGRDSMPRLVRASDIIDFWEEYEQHRIPLIEERDKREEARRIEQARWEREREERNAITAVAFFIRNAGLAMQRWEAERVARERKERIDKHLNRLTNVMITRGLERGKFVLNEYYLQVPRDELERWLGIESESA